jgi:hypothetical protein
VSRIAQRLGMTSGQLWTVSLGVLLGSTLLATSVPPVWERRGVAAPVAAAGEAVLPPPVVVPPQTAGGLAAAPPPAAAGMFPEPAPPLPVGVTPLLPAALAPEPSAGRPAAPAPSAQPVTPPGAAATVPLTVVEAGYSSTGPEPFVPAGGVPVSARLGARVSTAYLRLSGTATTLTVALSDASGATLRREDAAVRACRIPTDDWRAERPGPPVPVDEDDCVDGVLAGGAVSFDLSAYPERADRAGFAVVADLRGSSASSPRTFRLTLVPDPEDPA